VPTQRYPVWDVCDVQGDEVLRLGKAVPAATGSQPVAQPVAVSLGTPQAVVRSPPHGQLAVRVLPGSAVKQPLLLLGVQDGGSLRRIKPAEAEDAAQLRDLLARCAIPPCAHEPCTSRQYGCYPGALLPWSTLGTQRQGAAGSRQMPAAACKGSKHGGSEGAGSRGHTTQHQRTNALVYSSEP
jgi:hypothetical protein